MDLYNVRRALMAGKNVDDLELRVTYYLRGSEMTQEEIDRYPAYISERPNWTLVEGYNDGNLSGTSLKGHTAFWQMMDDAKKGKFDLILTRDFSRFSRNSLENIQSIIELLNYGVGVYFIADSINTLMPDSELRLTIMYSIAQEEMRTFADRVKWGFKKAIRTSKRRDVGILGYVNDNGCLKIVEEEAEIIRKIFEMYATEGLGLRSISTRLAEQGHYDKNGNQFSYSALRDVIQDPRYKGCYYGKRTISMEFGREYPVEEADIVVKDESNEVIPSIVSEELWDKANSILHRHIRHSDKSVIHYRL